jgi:hypothetical protein
MREIVYLMKRCINSDTSSLYRATMEAALVEFKRLNKELAELKAELATLKANGGDHGDVKTPKA